MDNISVLMDQVSWWHVILIAFLSLFTRILPRMFCPHARGKDAFYHLYAARQIQEDNFRLPKALTSFCLPGKYDYPPLLHYIWAIFPGSLHSEIEKWSSSVMDMLHCLAVYCFCIYWLSTNSFCPAPNTIALCIGIIYILSPSLTCVGTGPRAYQGTPRTLGELLFLLLMCSSVLYYVENEAIYLFGAGFFGGLLLLTSKFGAQVLIFFYFIFFLYFKNMAWIMIPLISVLMALIFSFGHYKNIALGHFRHSEYYFKAISSRFYLVTEKNRLSDLKGLFRNLFQSPTKAAKVLLMDNTYFLLLIKQPQIIFVLFLVFSGHFDNQGSNAILVIWIIAGIFAFLLTSLKPLLFLGEADRYLEYILLPQFLIIVSFDTSFHLFPIFAAYGIILYIVYASIFVIQYKKKGKDLPEFYEMTSFIRSEPKIDKILPIYLNDAVQLAYETKKKIAHFQGNFNKHHFPIDMFLFFYDKVYPFPNENIDMIATKMGFKTVYYSNSDLIKAKEHGLNYDFTNWEEIFANKNYHVFRFKG